MSDTARTILISYTALSIIGIVVGLIIYRSTRVGFHVRTTGRKTLEKRESYWGIAVVAFLVIVLAGTMVQIPYWDSDSDAKTPQQLEIIGQQYAWTVKPARAKADVRTRLVIRTKDVSHGVGVYDPDDVLVEPGERRARRHPGAHHHLRQDRAPTPCAAWSSAASTTTSCRTSWR